MIALIFNILFRNRTTSVVTSLIVVSLSLFTWHKLDKRSAVRAAVMEYVAQAELTAARAQIDEANRRAAIAEAASSRLQERVQAAEGEAIRIAREIQQYEATNDLPISGRVEPDIFDRLRGN